MTAGEFSPDVATVSAVECELLARNGRERGGEIVARCIYAERHNNGDAHPSLRYHRTKHAFLCDVCGAKGGFIELAKALAVWHDLPSDSNGGGGTRRIAKTYDYHDEIGKVLFQVVRCEPKTFRQRRPDGSDGWIWDLSDVRRVLYNLPDVRAVADAGWQVYVTEGEKDADAINALGLCATTNPGGAGKWREEFADLLRGAEVVVIADKDKPGRAHAQQVAASCLSRAKNVKVLELPGDEVKDAADWVSAGGTRAELERIAEAMAPWHPSDPSQLDATASGAAADDSSLLSPHSTRWPEPLTDAAYHGLAGEFVRLVSPHSEADPIALLAQFLIAFGSIVGRSCHFIAEAAMHFTNLFAVLVGDSSKSRKGSSWSHVRSLYRAIDDTWPTSSGLSSGEGLIWAVRDPIVKQEPVKEKHRVVRYELVEMDPGIDDKRLLVFQPEFASTLHAMERDGNTLSALVRQAWDDGDLNVMTKNTPARATAAHISMIGHITRAELLRYLDRTEMGNGFANRILWLCVRRSKLLPEGGEIDRVDLDPLLRVLREAVAFVRRRGEARVRRDDAARAFWHDIYGELSEGRPGMLGAITSRAEAQVMRLALVYALLDRSEVIQRVHLEAALALWTYADASAAFIFGDSLGDPVADELLRALRSHPAGMTRVDITNLFARHRDRGQLESALAALAERGLAYFVREKTAGRPAERWHAGAK